MQAKTGTFLCITVVITLAAAACSPLLPAPPAPVVLATSTPDLMGTALAETLTAIPTPSSTPLPPSRTPTVTKTQFPTITPIPSSTPLPSRTPKGAGLTATGTGTQSVDYACLFVSKSPPNWTVLKPRTSFDGVWVVKNIGLKPWRVGQVVLTFISGARLQAYVKTYQLVADVKPGDDQVALTVDLVSPKPPGDYTATWGLMETATKNVFCSFTTRIRVK